MYRIYVLLLFIKKMELAVEQVKRVYEYTLW